MSIKKSEPTVTVRLTRRVAEKIRKMGFGGESYDDTLQRILAMDIDETQESEESEESEEEKKKRHGVLIEIAKTLGPDASGKLRSKSCEFENESLDNGGKPPAIFSGKLYPDGTVRSLEFQFLPQIEFSEALESIRKITHDL